MNQSDAVIESMDLEDDDLARREWEDDPAYWAWLDQLAGGAPVAQYSGPVDF